VYVRLCLRACGASLRPASTSIIRAHHQNFPYALSHHTHTHTHAHILVWLGVGVEPILRGLQRLGIRYRYNWYEDLKMYIYTIVHSDTL